MDATTLPSFAVSSLCAATASCSAASLGYAWATTGEHLNHSSTSLDAAHAPASIHRPSTSLRRSGSRKRPQQRPQSAVVHSSRDSHWVLSPAAQPGNRASHQFYRTDTPVESLQETENSADENGFLAELSSTLPRRSKSTWFRKRRLTLTPSSGQSSTVTDNPPPSSPSLYTNASNAPFIPTSNPALNSRNRLVKRSTSQSLHGRPSLETGGNAFRPTFRRPATSHQRSVDSRVQALRHQHSQSSAVPSYKPSEESIGSVPRDHRQDHRKNWHWEPLFKQRIVRVKGFQEPSLKDPSSIFLGKKDELKCICSAKGELPTLVMTASITTSLSADDELSTPAALKRPVTQSFTDPTGLSRADRRFSQFREELPETSPSAPMSAGSTRTRFGFSYSNTSSTTSPTAFKVIRRRDSRKKKNAESGAADLNSETAISRSVSDTQASGGPHHGQTAFLHQNPIIEASQLDHERTGKHAITGSQGRRHSDVGSISSIGVHAFDVRGPKADTNNEQGYQKDLLLGSSHRVARRHSHSGSLKDEKDAPDINPLSAANLSSANARYIRNSRVVSDHGSIPGPGSDTDNSRVFSVNGEDTDAFSDTNYDSLRTGGTNSSSSGIRSTRIEHVFVDQGRETVFNGDVLSVLEEKLSNASLSSSSRAAGYENSSAGNGEGVGSLKGSILVATNASPRQQAPSRLTSSHAGESPDFNFSSSPSPHLSLRGVLHRTTSKVLFSEEDFDSFWDAPETNSEVHTQDAAGSTQAVQNGTHSPDTFEAQSLKEDSQSQQPRSTPAPKQAKIDLWRFSEHNPANITPDARPQTVHGKSTDTGGGRVVQRRTNHTRSHSEPKVADDMKPYHPDMFSLGKKGASENWDNDFEEQFSLSPDNNNAVASEDSPPEHRLEEAGNETPLASEYVADNTGSASSSLGRRPQSGILNIPTYITDMQGTVRGQFRAVGELKIKVEELRRLITQAERLNIKATERAKALREEAMGIIQLADAEEAEGPPIGWKHRRSPSGEDILSTSPAKKTSPLSDLLQAEKPKEVSPPRSMAEAIVKNMAASKPDARVGMKKTNFDTMALKELVGRANACVSALKMEIAEAEGGSMKESAAVQALQKVFKKNA